MSNYFPLSGINGVRQTAGIAWHTANESTYAIDYSSTGGTGPGGNLVACADGTVHLFSSGDAPCGTAPAGNNWFGTYGFYIVSTDNKWVYVYGHAYSITVSNGQTVHGGEVLGIEGNRGHSFGTHLHFSVVPMSEWLGGKACNGSQVQDYTTPFLGDSVMPKAPAGTSNQYPGTGQGAGILNQSYTKDGLLNIVPDKVVLVIDGQPDTENWAEFSATHNRYIGEFTGIMTALKDGHADKLLILNGVNNILTSIDINQDVEKGDQIHFNYTYSLQKYLNCSADLNEDQLSEILHYMTILTNSWNDGHVGGYDTQHYVLNKDGSTLTDVPAIEAKLTALLSTVTWLSKR